MNYHSWKRDLAPGSRILDLSQNLRVKCFNQPHVNMSFYIGLNIVNMFNLIKFEQRLIKSVDFIGN